MLFLPWLVSGFDWHYYIAGGAAASFSHTISVPFDVVKTRMQLNPELKSTGYKRNIQQIWKDEGASAFAKGLGSTLTGYAIQGSLKYGLFNEFKPLVADILHLDPSQGSKLLTFILAGAAAEFIGSSALTPFEALRIKAVGNSQLTSLQKPSTFEFEDLFRGFPALIAKQIPFTVVQLSSFELLTSFIYAAMDTRGVDTTESNTKLAITLSAAMIAGILSSVASHPGDTVLSVTNKSQRSGGDIPGVFEVVKGIYSKDGLEGFFSGFQARLVHVNVMVVSQLLVYDTIKQAFGIAATGAK